MRYKILFISFLLISFACDHDARSSYLHHTAGRTEENPYALIKDIPLPEGFTRIPVDDRSFAHFLRNVPLKKDKTVYLFNGQQKNNQEAQFAVLDISVGNRDLQQCADAVMRLRAEFFFARQEFGQIVFYDNEKQAYHFTAPYTRHNFLSYLDKVFGMCGSASLSRQLNKVGSFNDVLPGDVFVHGGFPGHAAIVMDMARNAAGKKVYLLAQGYMPAQDIHLLKNPANESLSPWYEVNDNSFILTPEYVFRKNELKRW